MHNHETHESHENKIIVIDLNCDMGEFTGEASIQKDAALMGYVSSVNIACGGHAGDETTMRRTVENAILGGIAVGAHPGYNDKENFGRMNLDLRLEEIYELVTEQVTKLKNITEDLGGKLHHVKPHGALYNQAAKDAELAHTIARAVKDIDERLVFYGLSGSHLISEAEKLGLRTASEVFADRTYQLDGSLTPRTMEGALITDEQKSIEQVLEMVEHGRVTTLGGETITIKADTICIHGDGEYALEFARVISNFLKESRIEIQVLN